MSKPGTPSTRSKSAPPHSADSPHSAGLSPYRGQTIAVGTKHDKQRHCEQPFADVLGARLHTPPDLDTDQFGTFAGERPRQGPPLDAARAKARLAVDASGIPYALASEASYGPLPGSGIPGHEEILVFCDTLRGLEIVEGYRAAGVPGGSYRVAASRELPPGLLSGLPHQALIVRSASPELLPVKGITDRRTLDVAIAAATGRSDDGLAVVEPDLRAHHNPSRQRVLARLARTLATRLAVACPECSAPGFGRVGTETGLPCGICRTPTELPLREIHQCGRCQHTEPRPAAARLADPAHCPYCNP